VAGALGGLGFGRGLWFDALIPSQCCHGGLTPGISARFRCWCCCWSRCCLGVLGGALDAAASVPAWLLPVALLLFAGTRLPTGNVWDAVMDPLLWLFLHGAWPCAPSPGAYRRSAV